MHRMKLCVVGGGKMAEALVGGLVADGWAESGELGIIEISEERRAVLRERFENVRLAESCEAAVADEGFDVSDILIAVKPQHVVDVATRLAGGGACRALSIAAGVRLDALESAMGSTARLVRAMPNTPALVGEGAAAISASAGATEQDLRWARSILESVGSVEVVDEERLDAVTGLSGSGPAYVFLLAEAMTAAAIGQGLTAEMADSLTRKTLLGAARLLADQSDVAPAQLRANVTSPGGTTAAAIASFEADNFAAIVERAIAAATARSRELASQP